MKRFILLMIIFNITLFLYAKGSSEGNLDRSIDNQAYYIMENIPKNSIIAIIGISSASEDLSKYITEGITSYIMYNNKSNIKIVERAAMPILQKEINFQYSGAANDNFMVSLGKMVGANTVIAGTIYSINNDLRFNVRAIEIETSYVIASNGIDFVADSKVKSLLKGGSIKETLSRDKIPIRQNDGSISKANQELIANQQRALNDAISFFSKEYFNREPRWILGYNYFPDFPLGFEFGYLRNGLGIYYGNGFGLKNLNKDYSFSYIGEYIGLVVMALGITYPLYFNWLWIAAGAEFCYIDIATSYTNYEYIDNYINYEGKFGFNPSIGVYLSFKRLYFTAKYRYIFYGNNKNSFMFGLGIGF